MMRLRREAVREGGEEVVMSKALSDGSMPDMFKKIAAMFRGRPALVTGAGKLAEGETRIVTFGDVLAGDATQVAFTRVDGQLHAIDAICPHQGVLMGDGPLHEGKYVVCEMHMYRFDPKTGKERGGQCRSARVFKVREVGEDAEVWI